MRPNFWPNTPDILPQALQHGGPAMFRIRAVLAALLSPSWGIYAGYELFEHVARPGAEEYLDNEKFELRPRDWAAAEAQGRSLAPFLARLNAIRRANPALHRLRNLRLPRDRQPGAALLVQTRPGHRQHGPGGLHHRPAQRCSGATPPSTCRRWAWTGTSASPPATS